MSVFLITICFINIVFCGLVFWFVFKQKSEMSSKLHQATVDYGQDFMQKMDFFFNRINQSKDDTNKNTLSVVEPISRVLEKLNRQIDDFEKVRISRDSNLSNNIKNLIDLQHEIKVETGKLRNVLKKPNTRGKWGEIQLQRIAEITGMLPFCEFSLQNSDIEGIRPDMVINLPNGGCIFVDAKTPLDAYMKLLDEDDIETTTKENCKAIKNHIYLLSNKKYWEKARSPDFVIMFIPLEHTWLSALEVDPKIMEYASEKNVVVATPMTLIGLFKTVFLGWSQVRFAEESENLRKSIQFLEQFMKEMGKSIDDVLKHNGIITREIFKFKGFLEQMTIETQKYNKMEMKPKIDSVFNDSNQLLSTENQLLKNDLIHVDLGINETKDNQVNQFEINKININQINQIDENNNKFKDFDDIKTSQINQFDKNNVDYVDNKFLNDNNDDNPRYNDKILENDVIKNEENNEKENYNYIKKIIEKLTKEN